MTTGARRDPYLSFGFAVEIDGLTVGGFSEVSGLQAELEVHDYREGGMNTFMRKFAGPSRYPSNLVLKHGLVASDELAPWFQAAQRGEITRRNISVILRDPQGEEVRRWAFEGAYPVKWSGPDLRANASEVAVETLELVHRGLM